MKKAFTLIELLIVVAIIAILAAIAVPNFLEAQTRSKVSRTKADLRTLVLAIESYAVDYNKAPREYNTAAPPTGYGDPLLDGEQASGIIWPGSATSAGLSTPIAYITTALLTDPFVQQADNIPEDEKTFTYQNLRARIIQSPSSAFWPLAVDFYGEWRLCSIGPDRDFSNVKLTAAPITNSAQLSYDATNGTISPGNIWRSQKAAEASQPSPPLLGAH
ncbi:MAG: prepilin-type N-terminal cleavage/methylation domain-containing protein [Candidatus Sumerlaeia bacterium]|nr:prepilin-type N-terminal cleavage/methylation domain-containing protein [Candidatus Sumerlaeia bacterium]